MRLRALVLCLSLLAACSKTVGTLVSVDVDSATPLPTAASLRVDAIVGTQQRQLSVALSTPGFPPAHSFNLQVAPSTIGQLTVHVDVLDGAGAVIASGDGAVTLAPGSSVPLPIALAPLAAVGGNGDGDDLGTPADLGVAPAADMATCPSGQHVCGGGCVANDVHACGDSCAACAVPANATSATCDGVSCGVVCANGYHDCGGSCVSNASTDSCGASSCVACTAPTGGSATCDGTQCGGSCPSGQMLCAGSCIAADAPCNGTCPTGTHNCSGLCESDTSTNSCGTMCVSCMPPANSTPTCGGTPDACGFACNTGYKACNSACIAASGCCTNADCPAQANATVTCSASHVCVATCNSSYKACDGTCIASSSCCTAADCTPPANATASCTSGSCGFGCNSGYVAVGSACDVAAPRPTSPPSTSRATTRTPLLQWKLPAGVSGAQVTLCADRACGTKLGTFSASGSSYQPSLSVSGNVLYWKLSGMIGSAVGGITSPTWEVFLPAKSASYANAFGSVLDVNGDGLGDVVVGVWDGNGAFVIQGSKSGPDFAHEVVLSTSATDAGFGTGVGNAGDVDGDGFGDVLVTLLKAGAVQIFHGSASGVVTTAFNTINYAPMSGSHGAAGIGDVNGDGYADIAIGVENLSGGPDHVYIFYGGPTGVSASPAVTLTGPTGQLYGINVYPLGDIDGDHLADFEVATQNDNTAYIYFGSATAGVRNPTAPLTYAGAANSRYGYSASGGDVNGDGISDFLLGGGAANLYLGVKGGNPTVQSIPMPSAGHSGFFGNVVGICGDINHDGYADLVIGDAGIVFYYAGGASGPNAIATAIYGPSGNGNYPTQIGAAGDMNGDGFDDPFVSAQGFAAAGVIEIYPGGASGVSSSTTAWTGAGTDPNALFGSSAD
ncbi:MAG TPA: VCBS repeat-containing protein [Polyangia bacterium]|jgi:hypothetical protein